MTFVLALIAVVIVVVLIAKFYPKPIKIDEISTDKVEKAVFSVHEDIAKTVKEIKEKKLDYVTEKNSNRENETIQEARLD